MRVHRNLAPALWAVSLGLLLGSCASTAPVELDKAVRLYNVYRVGGEVLPRKVEGCEYVDAVVASVPSPDEAKGVTLSDPNLLLETIRARAHGKGADTAFVSIAGPILKNPNRSGGPLVPETTVSNEHRLRATVFRCGDSPIPQDVGSPLR
jgi:hypothetical protein